MTEIENIVDETLSSLRLMRGALMVIADGNQLTPPDYTGLCGQLGAYVSIAQKEVEGLNRIIKDLINIAPKHEEEDE